MSAKVLRLGIAPIVAVWDLRLGLDTIKTSILHFQAVHINVSAYASLPLQSNADAFKAIKKGNFISP